MQIMHTSVTRVHQLLLHLKYTFKNVFFSLLLKKKSKMIYFLPGAAAAAPWLCLLERLLSDTSGRFA